MLPTNYWRPCGRGPFGPLFAKAVFACRPAHSCPTPSGVSLRKGACTIPGRADGIRTHTESSDSTRLEVWGLFHLATATQPTFRRHERNTTCQLLKEGCRADGRRPRLSIHLFRDTSAAMCFQQKGPLSEDTGRHAFTCSTGVQSGDRLAIRLVELAECILVSCWMVVWKDSPRPEKVRRTCIETCVFR